MITRRSVVASIFACLGMAAGQAGILKDGKVVACGSSGVTVKCPMGHTSCRELDAYLVVGTGSRSYPDWSEVFAHKLLRCSICGVLWTEKEE